MNRTTQQARINGTEIHYVEAGDGPPLVLLHPGLTSTDPVWDGHPGTYGAHLPHFARRFRVIAPDTRGCGRTLHPAGGAIRYPELAADLLALCQTLKLERPALAGFSDGATIATLAAARAPGAFSAVVNHAGFDMFDPGARAFTLARQVFGGSPEATEASPEATERTFASQGPVRADFLRRLKADHQAQAPDGWKTTLRNSFPRFTTPGALDAEELRQITAPTLILTGDRDLLCPPEGAPVAYRMLANGELGIVPALGHEVSSVAVEMTLAFLERHAR
jgi:pimeloyl-ACP methyl ester carboxylesterase